MYNCGAHTREILDSYLEDTVQARILRKDGSYSRLGKSTRVREAPAAPDQFKAQEFLMGLAEGQETPRQGLSAARHK
jgi:hypothetical protein